MKKIIIAGSINMDIVSTLERLPVPGEGLMGPDFSFIPGGKGANQAVAASRLGGSVVFLGKVGDDYFGRQCAEFLRREKMEIHNLGVSKAHPTGTALIMIDKQGTNIMSASSGANFDITVAEAKKMPLRAGDIVVSTLEIPQAVTKTLFERGNASGATTVLNAAPAWAASKQLLRLPDYIIFNEHELAFFVGSLKALPKFLAKHQTGIVTFGGKGLWTWRAGQIIKLPAHKVKAKDTTAAGDCFVGAFAVALAENKTLKQALEFANAAAAVSVQTVGASASMPKRRAVETFLKR